MEKEQLKMNQKKSAGLQLFLIYLVGLGLYHKALFNFFTHDDFFALRTSQVQSLRELLPFFNLYQAPVDWGFYRPITTQLLYFLNWKLFGGSYLGLNLMAFLMFLAVMLLVYQLVKRLTNKPVAILTAWLYVTSASHFTHLYFVADQELGHAIFFLSSTILFIDYLLSKRKKIYFLSCLAFIGALMSRETAVTLPLALIIVALWLRLKNKVSWSVKELSLWLAPFGFFWGVYVYLHLFHYGLIKGESYIWSFSPKVALNSLFWYGLWSLNLPQMLVDYVGSGFKLNPNLFSFWGKEMTLIFSLFSLELSILLIAIGTKLKYLIKHLSLFALAMLWFAGLLLPVLFLPWHKFTIYLTLPVIGLYLSISLVLYEVKKKLSYGRKPIWGQLFIAGFLGVYISLAAATLQLTAKTHWITQGAKTAKRVYQYFINFQPPIKKEIKIYFYDQPQDNELPWSPANELKVILSDNNFFQVFFKDKIKAYYVQSEQEIDNPAAMRLPARQFLGY